MGHRGLDGLNQREGGSRGFGRFNQREIGSAGFGRLDQREVGSAGFGRFNQREVGSPGFGRLNHREGDLRRVGRRGSRRARPAESGRRRGRPPPPGRPGSSRFCTMRPSTSTPAPAHRLFPSSARCSIAGATLPFGRLVSATAPSTTRESWSLQQAGWCPARGWRTSTGATGSARSGWRPGSQWWLGHRRLPGRRPRHPRQQPDGRRLSSAAQSRQADCAAAVLSAVPRGPR